MTIPITFPDPAPSLSVPGVRQDRRTGQFVPTVNGKDVSPTSFDEVRAMSIAVQTIARDAQNQRLETLSRDLDTMRRQRQALELALAELGRGNVEAVKQWITRMNEDAV